MAGAPGEVGRELGEGAARELGGTTGEFGGAAGATGGGEGRRAVAGRGPVAPASVVAAVSSVAGAGTAAAGLWALLWPWDFARAVGFPMAGAGGAAGSGEHFLHDLGASQLGLAAVLLLGCVWGDAAATALAGFLVFNAVHTVNHIGDLSRGGHSWHIAVLAAATAALAVALALRLRQLGWVTGRTGTATRHGLAPYVRQKTVRLTTYRRDGGSGGTPVSVAVDGDRGYLRSFERSLKTGRLAHDPRVRMAPSNGRGAPDGTGPELAGRLRRLERGSAEDRRAARLLRAKYPLLHGVLVPLSHRVLLRRRTGGTVHFVLTVDGERTGESGGSGQQRRRG